MRPRYWRLRGFIGFGVLGAVSALVEGNWSAAVWAALWGMSTWQVTSLLDLCDDLIEGNRAANALPEKAIAGWAVAVRNLEEFHG